MAASPLLPPSAEPRSPSPITPPPRRPSPDVMNALRDKFAEMAEQRAQRASIDEPLTWNRIYGKFGGQEKFLKIVQYAAKTAQVTEDPRDRVLVQIKAAGILYSINSCVEDALRGTLNDASLQRIFPGQGLEALAKMINDICTKALSSSSK